MAVSARQSRPRSDTNRWELSAAELAAIQADLFEFPIAKREGE